MESNTREVDGDPLYVYVHDVGTSYTWMARIEIEGFLSAATSIREQGEEVHRTISAHLANLIGDLVEKRSQIPTTSNLEAQKQLVKGKLDEDGPPGCSSWQPCMRAPRRPFLSTTSCNLVGTSSSCGTARKRTYTCARCSCRLQPLVPEAFWTGRRSPPHWQRSSNSTRKTCPNCG